MKKRNFQHKELANGRWNKFSIFAQMANVGAEVGRAINWREKNKEYSQMAFERALELIDLMVEDKNNRSRLKEICRLREVLVDYFAGDNIYNFSDKLWGKYFYPFNYAARINT